MNRERLPFTGERFRRTALGFTVTLLLMLFFGLGAVAGDGKTVGYCTVIALFMALTSIRNREKTARALRRQIWTETCALNPGASDLRLLEFAAESWKQDKDADFMRKAVEILATAAFCLLMMIWASAGGRMHRFYQTLSLPASRAELCWTLSLLGLTVLTPLHALIAAVPWIVSRKKTPDFSDLAAETKNDVVDQSEAGKPLAVIELTGDPYSSENREKLLRDVRSRCENVRGRIWIWALLVLLLVLSVVGLFRSGVLAAMCMIFLLCAGNLLLCSLPTAYSLRQSGQILRGLDHGALRVVEDTLLYRESREFNSQLGSDAEKGPRSSYMTVCLENAGCWAVGKGKSYFFSADPKTAALLPESGPVYLVYVPELKQPYMLCVPKAEPSAGEETP